MFLMMPSASVLSVQRMGWCGLGLRVRGCSRPRSNPVPLSRAIHHHHQQRFLLALPSSWNVWNTDNHDDDIINNNKTAVKCHSNQQQRQQQQPPPPPFWTCPDHSVGHRRRFRTTRKINTSRRIHSTTTTITTAIHTNITHKKKNAALLRFPLPAATTEKFSSSSRSIDTTYPSGDDADDYDVVIVGGGIVGAALANQLHQTFNSTMRNYNYTTAAAAAAAAAPAAVLRIALVEASPGPATSSSSPSLIPNPRSYALSPASMALLFPTATTHPSHERDSANPEWTPANNNNKRGTYHSMQVWEAGQPASLLLSTHDLDVASSSTEKQHQKPFDENNNSNNNDDDPFLGCCMEDSVVLESLWNALKEAQLPSSPSNNNNNNSSSSNSSGMTLWPSTRLTDVDWTRADSSGWTHATLVSTNQPPPPYKTDDANNNNTYDETSTKPNNGRRIRTRLLVAADGSQSALRQAAGIEMMQLDYGQTALTFTVQLEANSKTLENPKKKRAYQRFLSTGPLALLPTWSDRHAVVVWTTTPEMANEWKHQPNSLTKTPSLVQHLNSLLQTGPELLPPFFASTPTDSIPPGLWSNLVYGVDAVVNTIQYGASLGTMMMDSTSSVAYHAPPLIQEIVSPLFTFPLQCQIPAVWQNNAGNNCYTRGTHFAVAGDAAHTVHPMAGQGLNLGLQDVAVLVQCIERAVQAGMPLGTFLGDYERSRQQQVTLTVAGIHSLHQVFANQSSVGKHGKALGMNLIQNLDPLRRRLVQAACHGVVNG